MNEITDYQRRILDHFTVCYDDLNDGAQVLCNKCGVNLIAIIPHGQLGMISLAAMSHWKYIHGPWPAIAEPKIKVEKGVFMGEPEEKTEETVESAAEEAAESEEAAEDGEMGTSDSHESQPA